MICTRAQYRTITGDTATADATVDQALADAQRDLQERTSRLYEVATRTESLLVDREGYVYPKAIPLVSVSSPAQSSVDGNRVLVGSALNVSIGTLIDTRVAVTYVGGYAADEIPFSLTKLVARMAFRDLHPDVPLNATSIKVGDVSFSGDRLRRLIDGIDRDLLRWVHPSARLEFYA